MSHFLSRQILRSLSPTKELPSRNDAATSVLEETLVLDDRTSIGPAQFVEDKLAGMLREAPLHLSHARLLGLGRRSLG